MRVPFSILLALALTAPARAGRVERPPAAAADTAAGIGRAGGAGSGAANGDSAWAPDTLPRRLRVTQTIGGAEDGHPALAEPSGVACDAFGRVSVTDATQHRLVRFDPGGRWLDEAGSLGSDPGNLRRPAGAARVGSLGIAVLDRENRRVVLYDLFGRLVGVRTDLAALEDAIGRVDPIALAADRGGALYVADADGDRVLELDFSGALARTLGGYGTGGGSFRGLAGLGVGPRGELVTAERTGARVQRLDAGGNPLASWPIPVAPGRGALPVAVDDSSRIAVADEAGGTLWLFDRGGLLLARRAALARPRALAFAPDGSLLVAESAAGRVRRFVIEGPGPAAPGR
ncbi:MAG TPA: NHL repeat-containing protein [Terriglobales bacterium]|nr:NHL repeat-containing protein [Terriglobales bacterium]